MRTTLAVLAGLAGLAAAPVLAQTPRGESKLTLGGKTVAVEYGRPSLKGRDMLGKAEIGRRWRMGADAATTLKTEADLAFGSVAVPKGQYVLMATRVSETDWQLEVLDDSRQQVAQVPLAPAPVPESVETLTIELQDTQSGGEFVMTWGTTSLKTSFTAK